MQALIKAAKRAAKAARAGGSTWGQATSTSPPVWAPSLVQEGWAGVVASINSWGKQHVGWALCIDQNIAKVSKSKRGVAGTEDIVLPTTEELQVCILLHSSRQSVCSS